MEKRVQDYTQDILAVIRSNTSPAAMSSKLEKKLLNIYLEHISTT